MIKYLIFFLVIFLLLINCSENDPIESDPPNIVLLVQKEEGFDMLEVERGIDAGPNPDSDVNSIQLVWYEPEDERALAYFNVYRSEDPEGKIYYEPKGSTENQVNALDTVFTDSTQGLSTYNRYWYYVTAVNEDGKESEPSDTVYYRLIDKAYDLLIDNSNPAVVRQPNIQFKWSVVKEDFEVTDSYLRIEHMVTENFHPMVYIIETGYNPDPPITYTVSIDSFNTPVVNGGQYRWRIDCRGMDLLSGSESDWAYFTVNLEN